MQSDSLPTEVLELIDLVEEQLPPARAAEVRARIESDPTLLALIEQMRNDRAVLLADPEPTLGRDLVFDLERELAKPMLLDDEPAYAMPEGAPRTARRARLSGVQRGLRIAVAAGFFLTLTAGMLAIWSAVMSDNGADDSTHRLALNDDADRSAPVSPDEQNREARAAIIDVDRGDLHHWDATVPDRAMVRSDEPADANERLQPALEQFALANGAPAVESSFVVRLHGASDETEALGRVSELVGDLGAATLVRTFDYADVKRAWDRMSASSSNRQNDQWVAALRNASPKAFSTRQTSEFRARVEPFKLGEHIAGPRNLAPPAEHQYRFGEAGVRHAMTIPAADLRELLRTLDREFNATLGPFDSEAASDDGADTFGQWQRWRVAMDWAAHLESLDPNVMIVVPIAVD